MSQGAGGAGALVPHQDWLRPQHQATKQEAETEALRSPFSQAPGQKPASQDNALSIEYDVLRAPSHTPPASPPSCPP